MKFADLLLFTVYGLALILVFYFVMGMFYQPGRPSVVVLDETPVIYQEPIYPWYGGYNWYPSWFPFVGGYGGG